MEKNNYLLSKEEERLCSDETKKQFLNIHVKNEKDIK